MDRDVSLLILSKLNDIKTNLQAISTNTIPEAETQAASNALGLSPNLSNMAVIDDKAATSADPEEIDTEPIQETPAKSNSK